MTSKPMTVLGGLALCAVAGVLLTTTWVSGTPQGGLGGGTRLDLSGPEATSMVRPALLTAAAGLLVAAFLGPVARRVAGVVVVLSGIAVVAGALLVVQDPASPVAQAAAEAWGLADASSVQAQAQATWAPWATAAAGVLLALTGVAVLLARWQGLGSRYDREGAREPADEPLWDSLSRGEDPT
ncbi:Trp biosynthesis-associated membrane protein [Kytococcus sedentarius]|uniref:Trp biosynthesis-associated membrane protein n=1 Tax=Kytococcus sedentarius TaxID=1276 RepID=UPI0035BC7DC0